MPKRSPFPPKTDKPLPGSSRKYPAKLTEAEIKTSYKARYGYYDQNQCKAIYARHKNALLKEEADCRDRVWNIGGLWMNRYELMDYIVIMLSEGMDLVTLCDQEEFPTLAQVQKWYKRHPDFRIAVEEAERIRGIRLGEDQIKVMMDANPVTATLAKAQSDALGKAAARLNAKYQDKQVVQTENITEYLSLTQIEAKIANLVDQFPALKTIGIRQEEAVVVENESQVVEGGID